MDQLYPRHAQTLKNANLNPPKYPSINEVNEETDTRKKLKEAKFNSSYRRKTSRDIFFCIGYSDSWSSPIHKIISNIQSNFDLKWLRLKMSYHIFPNLQEMFNGDLQNKIMQNIESITKKRYPQNIKQIYTFMGVLIIRTLSTEWRAMFEENTLKIIS